MSTFGVAITTYGRPQTLADTLAQIRKRTPPDVPVVVIDDGSCPPCPHATHRFGENRGIAAAKNKCLEILAALGVEHMFLLDSDTYPIRNGWWEPYVASPEPHLMLQFARAPSHWTITQTYRDEHLVAYDRPRGAMLYVHRRVLDVVGGMHLAWGKHGGEHGDWSDRIHRAGLTTHPYADVTAKTVECLDQRRAMISSIDHRAHQHWKTVDAAKLPLYAEYREQPVPVLVPRRADHGHRDNLWKHLQVHYWDSLPGYRIVEGEHESGPFNRSAAVNRAARSAGNWDVAVIADSDTWVPPAQLDDAVSRARETGKLVSALTSVIELSQATTDRILAGPVNAYEIEIGAVRTADFTIQSSMLAIPRILFDRVGGMDENFVGWGGEDNALWKACAVVAGEPLRVPGAAFHLWHKSVSTREERSRDPGYRANWDRWRRYERARTVKDLDGLTCSR